MESDRKDLELSITPEIVNKALDDFVIELADTINSLRYLKDVPWREMVETLQFIREHHHEVVLFSIIRDTLYHVPSYSKRIECLVFLKQNAYFVIEDKAQLLEWEDACVTLTEYYSKLRELVSEGRTITHKWEDKLAPLDEFSFLCENISSEEMIVLMQQSSSFVAHHKIDSSSKAVIADISRIFGKKVTADVGNYDIIQFCLKLFAANTCRMVYTTSKRVKEVSTKLTLPPALRNGCFDIYIHQRIKYVMDQLIADDETRPFLPSEVECRKYMLEEDKEIFEFTQSKALIDSFRKNKEKMLQDLDKEENAQVDKDLIKSWISSCESCMPQVVNLMQCFIRYEEAKICELEKKTNVSPVHIEHVQNLALGDNVDKKYTK